MEKREETIEQFNINSTDELLKRYGDLFLETSIDGEFFYLAVCTRTDPEPFRIIITPSGVVAVTSINKLDVWDINPRGREDSRLFHKLDSVVSKSIDKTEIPDLIGNFEFENQRYFTRILPYSDPTSSELLIHLLNEKIREFVDLGDTVLDSY